MLCEEIKVILQAAREQRGDEQLAKDSYEQLFGESGTPTLGELDDLQLLQVLFIDLRYKFATNFFELQEFRENQAAAKVKLADARNSMNRQARRHR